MKKKIVLIMGLAGSGKSTLAKKLSTKLNAEWLNADKVRAKYNDWDFSKKGILNQSLRMKKEAKTSKKKFVITDFICPYKKGRNILKPNYTIWVDTIKKSRFRKKRLEKIFESPTNYDIKVTTKDSNFWSKIIFNKIKGYNMKILVTGGSGFVGSHVADELTNRGHNVIIYDLLKSKWIKKNQKLVIGNITDTKKLSNLIRNVDIVYNFAALGDLDKARVMPLETVNYNIMSLVNMLKLSKKFKIKRFVQASSVYADSEEGGFYGRSKRAAEDYMVEFDKIFNLPYTILRFGSLYGPRADDNNGIKKLIKSAKTKKKIVYRGNKRAVRRYIHVEDAANLSAQILSPKYKNKILAITGKKSIKVYNLINFLSKKFKLKTKNNLFLNEKNTAHYKDKPTPLLRKSGTNIFIKKEKNFKESILKLLK